VHGLGAVMYYLDFVRADMPSSGERLDLLGTELLIGRADSKVSALTHLSVSRRHARLVGDKAGNWSVQNLTDGNVLTVNGKQVGSEPQPLSPGDRLQFGEVEANYCLDLEATIPPSQSGLLDLRSAEIAERFAIVEEAIAGLSDRLERNEALDEGTRQSLEHVAGELRNSGVHFQYLAQQLNKIGGISLAGVAFSLFTMLAVGIVRDTQKTNDFLRALYEQVGSPEGAAQVVVAGLTTFYAIQQRKVGGAGQNQLACPLADRDMETASDHQTAIQTRYAQPDRYPVSSSEFTSNPARGDRFGG